MVDVTNLHLSASPYYFCSLEVVARVLLQVEKTKPLCWLAIAAELSFRLLTQQVELTQTKFALTLIFSV